MLLLISFLIQYDLVCLLNFKFNSSLEINLKKRDIGVNIPKNMTAIIIGLTILPRNKPSKNHSLFNGFKNIGLIKEIVKKIIHRKAKKIPSLVLVKNKKYKLKNKKIIDKKIPKFLFVAVLILDSFFMLI